MSVPVAGQSHPDKARRERMECCLQQGPARAAGVVCPAFMCCSALATGGQTRERSRANTGLRRQEIGSDTVPSCVRLLQGDSGNVFGGLCVPGLAAE